MEKRRCERVARELSIVLSELVVDHSSFFGAKLIACFVEPVVCQLLTFATHCNSSALVTPGLTLPFGGAEYQSVVECRNRSCIVKL